jgi:hypothetical protein
VPKSLTLASSNIGAEPDHLKPLAVIASIESLESRHFLAARWTPGGPKINHYDLAPRRAQIEGLTAQLLDDHGGSGLPDIRNGLSDRVLKQPSLTFKIHWLYIHCVASHLERQFHRDARCETRLHSFQLVSVAAKSAEEGSAGTNVALMIHVAALAGVEGRFNPSCGVTG